MPSHHGAPPETLAAAVNALAAQNIHIVKASRIWLTAPVPTSDQPWYHNQVVQVETGQAPFALLETLQRIENDFGRAKTVRHAPRVLDLDLIAYHDEILDGPELIVPHPLLRQRAFVLLPLREIAPDWIHPVTRQPLSALIAALPDGQEAKPLTN